MTKQQKLENTVLFRVLLSLMLVGFFEVCASSVEDSIEEGFGSGSQEFKAIEGFEDLKELADGISLGDEGMTSSALYASKSSLVLSETSEEERKSPILSPKMPPKALTKSFIRKKGSPATPRNNGEDISSISHSSTVSSPTTAKKKRGSFVESVKKVGKKVSGAFGSLREKKNSLRKSSRASSRSNSQIQGVELSEEESQERRWSAAEIKLLLKEKKPVNPNRLSQSNPCTLREHIYHLKSVLKF